MLSDVDKLTSGMVTLAAVIGVIGYGIMVQLERLTAVITNVKDAHAVEKQAKEVDRTAVDDRRQPIVGTVDAVQQRAAAALRVPHLDPDKIATNLCKPPMPIGGFGSRVQEDQP